MESLNASSVDQYLFKPFVVPPADPLIAGPGGVGIRTLVRCTQTNHQFSSVEVALSPKKMGPSPHLHKQLDEISFVVEGTACVMVEETVYEISAGGWHMRPRGLIHTFWNPSDKPLRFIDMYLNQNFEEYLETLFFDIVPDMKKNNLTRTDPVIAKRMNDLDEKFGLVMFPGQRQAIIDKYGLKA